MENKTYTYKDGRIVETIVEKSFFDQVLEAKPDPKAINAFLLFSEESIDSYCFSRARRQQ